MRKQIRSIEYTQKRDIIGVVIVFHTYLNQPMKYQFIKKNAFNLNAVFPLQWNCSKSGIVREKSKYLGS